MSAHLALARRWEERRFRRSAMKKTIAWKTWLRQHICQVAGPGLLEQSIRIRHGQRDSVYAEVPCAFAMPRSVGQAWVLQRQPEPTYATFVSFCSRE